MLNKIHDSETGVAPYLLEFGSGLASRFKFPDGPLDSASAPKYIQQLDNDLKAIRSQAHTFNAKVIEKRMAPNSTAPQNLYQPGDFVTLKRSSNRPLPSKLSFRYAGPYEVLSHRRNDVSCRHLASGRVQVFDVQALNIFAATKEEAVNLAMADINHYEIADILLARGDPMKRTTMEFFIRFMDDTEVWVPLNKDLFDLPVYEDFVRARPPLSPLLYPAAAVPKYIRDLNKPPITEVQPGDSVFVDLRSWGPLWYATLGLPDADAITYVVACRYSHWVKHSKALALECPVLQETHSVTRHFVLWYGRCTVFDPDTMRLVDAALLSQFPEISPPATR